MAVTRTVEEFYNWLSSLSDAELVDLFNNDVGQKGWDENRVNFRSAMTRVFNDRKIDTTQLIIEKNANQNNKTESNGASWEDAIAMEKRNGEKAQTQPEKQEEFEAEIMHANPNDYNSIKEIYDYYGYEYDKNLWAYHLAMIENQDNQDE